MKKKNEMHEYFVDEGDLFCDLISEITPVGYTGGAIRLVCMLSTSVDGLLFIYLSIIIILFFWPTVYQIWKGL